MKVGYLVKSTDSESTIRQRMALAVCGAEKIFEEQTGENGGAEFRRMLQFLQKDDTIYMASLKCLSENVPSMLQLVDVIIDRKLRLVAIMDDFDTATASGKMILTLLKDISNYRRENTA